MTPSGILANVLLFNFYVGYTDVSSGMFSIPVYAWVFFYVSGIFKKSKKRELVSSLSANFLCSRKI